ncbi:hypothetical protein [Mesorhizobium sp. B4-1-4]|uniref:hypothetical protein n=1 Tax=Mesorhizobium sp. B4-1-4 TaxID=2589888 RepID=UPI00112B7CF9|nr:hypothetical protein [Mesorhizobium sp. B4-1-4]UCI33556.1 hypothetical protein FJW03_09080 [Mesorhizobium sp. B4-1-4]
MKSRLVFGRLVLLCHALLTVSSIVARDAGPRWLRSVLPPLSNSGNTLTADGSALVAELFKITAGSANVDRILPTDTPEAAQNKWRDWIG